MSTYRDVEMNGEAEEESPLQKPQRNLQLTIFRDIVGISATPALEFSTGNRPAPNKGIYQRTADVEYKTRLKYYGVASLINTCYLLQIVVAATLTALGAAHGPNNAITALGAINTIVAGLLTYLKGQGLPNRLRLYQNELRKVREYIEERERDFSRPDCQLDLDHEIDVIYQMYRAVRQNDEDNCPDTYHSFSATNGPKPNNPPQTELAPASDHVTPPAEPLPVTDPLQKTRSVEITTIPVKASPDMNGRYAPANAPVQKIDPEDLLLNRKDKDRQARGSRHMNENLSTARSGIPPNMSDRHVSESRYAVANEVSSNRNSRRLSTDLAGDLGDVRATTTDRHALTEQATAPIDPLQSMNSRRVATDRSAARSEPSSIRNSRRVSTDPDQPQGPSDPVPNRFESDARPAARIDTTSNTLGRHTSLNKTVARSEGSSTLNSRNVSVDRSAAQNEISPNSNSEAVSGSHRNSTVPVKQYLDTQRRF